jgi:hypothetical protein
MKHCRCCGRAHTLGDAHRLFLGWMRFDDRAYLHFNCPCGSTLVLELVNPRIRHARAS